MTKPGPKPERITEIRQYHARGSYNYTPTWAWNMIGDLLAALDASAAREDALASKVAALEQAAELQKRIEIDHNHKLVQERDEAINQMQERNALAATLARVRELPETWSAHANGLNDAGGPWCRGVRITERLCADELDAALAAIDPPAKAHGATDPEPSEP